MEFGLMLRIKIALSKTRAFAVGHAPFFFIAMAIAIGAALRTHTLSAANLPKVIAITIALFFLLSVAIAVIFLLFDRAKE